MRLDKYLKVSRLIKRRTVANEACDNARISVNGRPAKASYDVKVGDKISIEFGAPDADRRSARRGRGRPQGRRFRDVQRNRWGKPLNHLSAVFGGSFAPMPQFEGLEIHKGCLRPSNFALEQNLSPNTHDSCFIAFP